MLKYFEDLIMNFTLSSFLSAVVAFSILLLVRYLLIRAVQGLNYKNFEARHKWTSIVRNISLVMVVVIFFSMWGEELRSMAISLAAVAVALVLALKEIILSFIGGLLKVSSHLFEIGDRITVKGIRGEIIDHNFLTTTLFEIGPGERSNQYTGRQIKIPNSVFITGSMIITPGGNHYTLHVFTLPVVLDNNMFAKQKILLEAAEAVAAPYAQLAEEYITRMCRKQKVKVPDLKPRVLYEIPDPKTAEFHIRIPVPFDSMTRTTNKVKDMFFAEMFKRDW